MRKIIYLFTIILICFNNPINGQGISKPQYVSSPSPINADDYTWYRFTTENFTILALNKNQGELLFNQIENLKSWCMTKLGFSNIEFQHECKILCVSDPELYKLCFGLEDSHVEIWRDNNGKIISSNIWVLSDSAVRDTFPIPLTEVCIAEFAESKEVHFSFWIQKGLALLNGTPSQIKDKISVLDSKSQVYLSKSLSEIKESDYYTLDVDNKQLFDSSAMSLCLFLVKEFGYKKMQGFIKNPTTAPKEILNFANNTDFDQKFSIYLQDLTRELKLGRLPESYITVNIGE